MADVIPITVDNLDLAQIAGSGQCFRMNELREGRFFVISLDHYLEVQAQGRELIFFCETEEVPFWKRYFDLDTDYGAYLQSVKKGDHYLQEAARAGQGIRILNQDPWEMVITFILSQQKTIPKIREAVEGLCTAWGDRHETVLPGSGQPVVWHSFPTPAQLCQASLEQLKEQKLGYRAKYIYQVCRDAAEGRLDLKALPRMGYQEAMDYLTSFYGIGVKVANCICLFGLHHIEAFPIDTWINQILMREYYQKRKKKYDSLPKTKVCQEIVKDRFSCYKGYAGVMQQYIFYYERMRLGKVK